MKRLALVLAAVFGCGCGYVGEPLPPLLNVPQRVNDLAAYQIGSKIILQFSVPRLTTEGAVIKRPVRLEARGGSAPAGAFDADAWASEATDLGQPVVEEGHARYEIAAAPWAGKDIVFAVQVYGAHGRAAGWSNIVVLPVVHPLAVPTGIEGTSVAEGVRLTWKGTATSYRIFRRLEGEKTFSPAADVDKPEWVDTATEYGKPYHYEIQAFQKTGEKTEALSEISPEYSITPKDTFPPAVPAGLTVVPSTASVELVWDRNTESDLAGYRVYRDSKMIADIGETPSYSDHAIQSGKVYHYSVSSVDQSGNESKPCEAVEIAAP